MITRVVFFLMGIVALSACSREDTIQPVIILNPDPVSVHYRGMPYNDPGVVVADNYSCDADNSLLTVILVDTSKYGTYDVLYNAIDDAGNEAEIIRKVDIVLPLEDYYAVSYEAHDTCTSGIYFYTGLIQDCDCASFSVTTGNISNFGLSAMFTLPISGTYNEIITLDTTKAGVSFVGSGTMSPAADMIRWEYVISDSTDTDACVSTWIKE